MKINSKDFLKWYKARSKANREAITNIRFNKKSISVKIEDKQFFFNFLFNENDLYKEITHFLAIYIMENGFNTMNLSNNIDSVRYKYEKLNVR